MIKGVVKPYFSILNALSEASLYIILAIIHPKIYLFSYYIFAYLAQ